MGIFVNPFRKHDVLDFPDVLIPLHRAQRHPSVVAGYDQSEKVDDGKGLEAGHAQRKSSEDDASRGLTIEALRAEIDQDLAASGHDTMYDRTWP